MTWAKALVILLSIAVQTLSAQEYNFEHLTDKEGLVNNSVTSIVQDDEGFLWFGTMNGLSRYDGYDFKHYLHEPANPSSIKDNYIKHLLHSKSGKIFIGFRSKGFCIYDPESETFENFENDEKNEHSLLSNNVSFIHEDSKGRIWIGNAKGLDRYDENTKKFTHYYPFKDKQFGLVTSITQDKSGQLWLCGTGTSLCKFDPDKETYSYWKFSENTALNNVFVLGNQIKYDSHNAIWIGNEVEGISRHDLNSGEVENFSVQNGKLSSNVILFISEDKEGNVWIGADGAGLYRYNYASRTLLNIHNNPFNSFSLNGAAVYCLYESEPGMLWFGTYASGINILKKNKHKFNLLKNEGEIGKHLNAKSVTAVSGTSDGNIILGMNGGGVILFNRKSGLCNEYTQGNSGISGDIVKSVLAQDKDNIWCGTYGNGLCLLDLKTKFSKQFKQDVHGSETTIDRNHIWTMKYINQKLWIGTLTGPLNIYDPLTGKFSHDPLNSDGNFSPRDITSIELDKDSNVWIGTEKQGVFFYSPLSNTRIHLSNKGEYNFPSNDVRDIHVAANGSVWFATQKAGLVRLVDFTNQIYQSYTIKDGLPSNNIRKILEDGHGNLWMSSDKGIIFFNPQTKKFRTFDSEDGLQGNEFNPSSGFKANDGYMYFGGIDGLNFFHPDSINYNLVPPEVVFTDLKILNESIRPGKTYHGTKYLNASISSTREIKLNYNDYAFTIEFAALSYAASLKNEYAYMLEGFDHKWVHVPNSKRFATYTNLDPGEYTLHVIASNNDGIWSKEGAKLKIIITPPWWMNPIFKVIVLVILLSMLGIFYFLRWQNFRRQHQLLEDEVNRRTEELNEKNAEIVIKRKILEETNYNISVTNERILSQRQEIINQRNALEKSNKTKDRFFSIIGHDLRNPVTSLSFLISQLKEEGQKFNDPKNDLMMLLAESKVESIHRLVINILDWARTQTSQVIVQQDIYSLKQILVELSEAIRKEKSGRKIEFNFSLDDDLEISLDKNMVQTALKNFLGIAVKSTEEDIKLDIKVEESQDQLSLIFQETSNGFCDKIHDSLSGSGERNEGEEIEAGLGMMIAHEYLALNNAQLIVKDEPEKGPYFTIIFDKVAIKIPG